MRSVLRVLIAAATLASASLATSGALAQQATPTIDVAADETLSVTVNGTYKPLAGDFDGDGDDDIFWYAPGTAKEAIWESNGDGTFIGRAAPQVNRTYRPFTGDFDGDDDDEIIWYAPGTATDYAWFHNSGPIGTFDSHVYPIDGDYQPFTADLDGDGDDEGFWYAPGPAQDWVWDAQGCGPDCLAAYAVDVDGTYRPLPADGDNDGDEDIFWYAPGTATDLVWESVTVNSHTEHAIDLDYTQVPLVGEYDGAFGDVLFYGPGTQSDHFALHQADITAFSQQDTVVNGVYSGAFTGDFTGEGLTDIFWYQPGTGRDFLWLFS